ncbi:hypothetical protein A6770_28950 [Nostoc minutum NIES-26]|uniref:Uncharacterized protein n=1 Tax=Nostoc minutum NIES-26 TaxID=1844469 RepID=A0A367QI21_9NOSO|nr:hypothetical protein A6770_28950 [Nostoc minutum NIES-26]
MGSDSASKETQLINDLKEILLPWEKHFIDQIKQAYLACIPDELRKVWKDKTPTPNSLEEILAELQDIPQGETYIIRFIGYLLVDTEISKNIGSDLNQLGKQNANNFSVLLDKLKHEKRELEKDQDIPTYLMISLEKSSQSQNLYYVNAWFVSHENKGNFDCKKNQRCESLKLENQKIELRKIPLLLEELMNEVNRNQYLNKNCNQPMVILFLPFNLLNKPVDCYKYGERTIGCSFQLVLRYKERLKNKYGNEKIWHYKWKKLHSQDSNSKMIISADCEKLYAELQKADSVCLHSIKPLSKKNIDDLNSSATPVAIWLRNIPKKINYQDELNELIKDFQQKTHYLPKLIHEKRKDAVDIHKDNHIGHHLSILWEDPELLLPHIDYE